MMPNSLRIHLTLPLMRRWHRSLAVAAAPSLLVAAMAGLTSSDDSPLGRLRAMPLELRRTLAGNLDRFDRLNAADREVIQSLDAVVMSRPPEERARDLELMRRYRSWRDVQDEPTRARLDAASPQERGGLIRSIRDAEQAEGREGRAEAVWTLAGAFDPVGLGEEAQQAALWKILDSDQKAGLAASPTEWERMLRSQALAEAHKPPIPYRDVGLQAVQLRNQILAQLREGKVGAGLGQLKRLRGMQARHFRNHPPPILETWELARFESELPSWIRERLSGLPPIPARQRVAALHYLVHDRGATEAAPSSKETKPLTAPAEKRKGPAKPKSGEKAKTLGKIKGQAARAFKASNPSNATPPKDPAPRGE